jgi:hypothetical protein
MGNSFSSTANLILGALMYLGKSTAYFFGQASYIGGNLMQTFTKGVGFIMVVDFLNTATA